MPPMTDIEVARFVLKELLERGRCTRVTELWDADDSIRMRFSELARSDGKGVVEQWLSDYIIVGPAGVASLSESERNQLIDVIDKPIDKFIDLHRAEKDRVWSVAELARLCDQSEAHMAAAVFYRSRYLGGLIVSAFSAETGLHQQVTFTYDIRNRTLFAHRVERATPSSTLAPDPAVERRNIATRLRNVVERVIAGADSESWRSFAAAEWPTITKQLRPFTAKLEGLDSQIEDASDALRTYVVLPLGRGDRVNAANIRHVVNRIAIVCATVGGIAITMQETEMTPVKDIADDDDGDRIDVLIITATKDEYDEALKVDDGALAPWHVEKEGPAGLEVSFRKYRKNSGGELKVALTYSIRMREAATVAAALPAVLEYEPRYLAMCGACAGWRGKTNLGDVIVGETVWRADAGSRIIDEKGNEKFKPEPFGFHLRGKWKQKAQSFSMAGVAWLADRPLTLDEQSRWLLGRLFDGDQNPSMHDERRSKCPDWKLVIERLRKAGYLQPTGLAITEAGRAFVAEERLLYIDGFPPTPEFKVRVGAMATGRNVERDPTIFERLSDTDRTVLAVEMEAAALGIVAEVSDEIVRWLLVMKGVMDHGDPDKDDRFKPFACRAAAECLIAFLREVVGDDTEGAKRSKRPSPLASGSVQLARMFDEWSLATDPPVSDRLLRCGRADAVAKVQAWLAGEPSTLGIAAETQEEAIAFICASIAGLGEAERAQIYNRAIVVTTSERWRVLVESGSPLILIAAFEKKDLAITASATKKGHHVGIPVGPEQTRTVQHFVQLPRIGRGDAEKVLLDSGINEEVAREIAALARHGLSAMRRKFAVNAATLTPDWAAPDRGRRLLPAVLAGAWNDASEADRSALQELAGTTYDGFRENLLQQARESDPPVRLTGQIWSTVSREDSWSLLSRYLTGVDLQNLERVVVELLSETDPKYELPQSERWRASLHDKVLRHSKQLREGLTEALVLLAARGEDLAFDIAGSGADWATRIVGRVLVKCTSWVAWASLSPLLRLLAEAAPDRFLQAVDLDLSSSKPLLGELFTDSNESGFGSSSPHVDVLWALEVLACSPEYLSAVSLLLARYAALDPGGKLGNRPFGVLGQIFLLWHPSSAASLEQRLRALRLIVDRQPEIGWRLLVSLVPQPYGIGHDTVKPRWRDWALDERANVTYNELAKGTHEIVEMLLPMVGASGERWGQLIDIVERLAPQDAARVLKRLDEQVTAGVPDKEAAGIRAALRHQVTRHRQFADADWAMSADDVDLIEALCARLEPMDVKERYAWLFDERVELPLPLDIGLREREKVIAEKRTAYVKEIFEAHGEEGVLDFAAAVHERGEVGVALAQARVINDEPEFLLRSVGSDDAVRRNVGFGYMRGRTSMEPNWLRDVKGSEAWPRWNARQRADYYHCAEHSASTWDQVDAEEKEVQKLYWTEARAYGIFTEADQERLVVTFRKWGRLGSAVLLLARWEYLNQGKSNPDLIVETLEAVLADEGTEKTNWAQLSHEMSKLFDSLDAAGERFQDERIARLEWNFLPLIEHFRGAKILERTLAGSADFFVETLKLIYRAEDEEEGDVTAQRRELATRGYELLRNWKRLPGLRDDGTVDGKHLWNWVSEVRRLASEAKRGAIADIHVGYALANAPAGTDSVWPHEAVRDLVESVASEHLERAIATGIFNNRGVWMKSIGEGGVQERDIAARYAEYAAALTELWPRTSRVVKLVAQEYQADARGEDVRAELEDQLLG